MIYIVLKNLKIDVNQRVEVHVSGLYRQKMNHNIKKNTWNVDGQCGVPLPRCIDLTTRWQDTGSKHLLMDERS